MLPANALILICPYCKGEKPVLQLMSGNTFGGTQWSDLKSEYPMLLRPSVIQKCPHCGKYYFAQNVETKEGDDCSGDLGELTFEQIKEALTQFDKDWLSIDDEIELHLLFVHIYNDTFQREAVAKEETPTSEDKNLFEKQVLRLLQIWKTEPLLKAEFYREIGEFSQCIQILDTQRENDPFKEKIASKVRMLAEEHKSYAFVIEN